MSNIGVRMLLRLASFLSLLPILMSQTFNEEKEWKCPMHWVQFQSSCYRFIKSPLRSRNEARRNCQAFESDLVSVNTLEEHGFLIYQLLWQDPQHRRWYTGGRQQGPGHWVNDVDGSSISDMEAAFLPDSDSSPGKDYLVYSFSNQLKHWGFERVGGEELLLYICEIPLSKMHYLVVDDRTYDYGIYVENQDEIPRGPYFIKQPEDVVFDMQKQRTSDIIVSCLAGGYPTPTYEWFKENYELDKLVATKIDPLSNSRYTLSGGALIINGPNQNIDRGSYHCKATNEFGTIKSETVTISFGIIVDFNLKRAAEIGSENWGKVIFCDPPQSHLSVKYYWAREMFPNLVEQDQRVFVSYDGALYFSTLENIDQGNYSCSVQSKVSDTGRNGPFFPLKVNPHSNYQQLKFPNNFPKAFPEAPVAGKEVRLECVAFGYPVPSYNWTRKGTHLPRSAVASNFNRVLTIPHVQVEDQGEYVCQTFNDRSKAELSVVLTIQAEPNFTIPLTDKHMDNKGDLTWTCEAFGIPDVTYSWYRNGELLRVEDLPIEDKDRYTIQDNVLTIRYLDPDRDPAMYQCQAKNILKTRYSSAQLRVLSLKPDFRKKPLEPETYASEGGNVTIVCTPEAAPSPKFTWKKDNNVIGSGGRRRILENGNLIISPVSRDDDGIYTCSAQNMYGSDESRGRLIVLRGPSLNERLPPKVLTSVGKNIMLRCQAAVEELLDVAYIWTQNGMRLKTSEHDSTKIKIEGGYCAVHNISFAESGEYECIIKTAVGKISSKTIVIVEGPPGPPGGVQVSRITKRSVTLQWTDGATNGKHITHYLISGRTQWKKTWFNISDGVIAREVDRYNGRKEAALENVLTPYSVYEFRVQAANIFGLGIPSAPSPKHNTLNDKPYKAPENIGGGGGKTGDLTITWKPLPPEEQHGPGIYYIVFWKRHTNSETEFQSLNMSLQGNVGVTVAKIPYEFFYTKYDVKVQVANSEGAGPESNVTTIYSAEDMPQLSPQQVSARAFNSTAMNVTWIQLEESREIIRGKLIGHRLKYWKRDNTEEDSVYYLSRSTRPWALIVGLQPDTYYYVKVMAYNSAGEGPESERFLEKTYRQAPQKPPSSVNAYGINPTTVRVVWRYVQPGFEEEPVIGYKVRVWETDQDISSANDTIIHTGSKLEVYVNNLSPGKTYHMRVLAFSNGGDGRMSSPAFTFQMGDADAFRSPANKPYLTTLAMSVLFLLFLLEIQIRVI